MEDNIARMKCNLENNSVKIENKLEDNSINLKKQNEEDSRIPKVQLKEISRKSEYIFILDDETNKIVQFSAIQAPKNSQSVQY